MQCIYAVIYIQYKLVSDPEKNTRHYKLSLFGVLKLATLTLVLQFLL